ncbi:MAG: hypothetical protein H7263_17730 [Candidatus Sericytochromatia bacterium]|nr:hypothetical protein [Candidatus Sericytochromatia bacterium]
MNTKDLVDSGKTWQIKRTTLLSRMAVSLGYKSIEQTTFLEDYYPEGHESELKRQIDFFQNQSEYYRTAFELNNILIHQYTPESLGVKKAKKTPE